MRKRITPSVYGLDDFGLTKRGLRDLGKRSVTVEIDIPIPPYVYPSAASFRTLVKKSPEARRRLVHQWRTAKHRLLVRELPFQDYEVVWFNSDPSGIRLTVAANETHRLFGLRHAESIRIKSISGLTPTRRRTASAPERLYAVKAQLTCQAEGQTKGMQLCETRIFLVVARSEGAARRRAVREFRDEDLPAMTTSGHFFRWHFEGIVDVCEPVDRSFDPTGTEVYYKYHKRRIRPQNEWHPNRSSRTMHSTQPGASGAARSRSVRRGPQG